MGNLTIFAAFSWQRGVTGFEKLRGRTKCREKVPEARGYWKPRVKLSPNPGFSECLYRSLGEASTYIANDYDRFVGVLFHEYFGGAGTLAADIEAGGEVTGVNLHALEVVVYGLCVGVNGDISY